jgi:tripartite-type tricarboxylate transporter receptor subunit TctC
MASREGVRTLRAIMTRRSLAVLWLSLFAWLAHAADYPVRPITFIVPWGAGGGTDAVGRVMASLLERELGRPVNVINRTGGIGARRVRGAARDNVAPARGAAPHFP